MFLSLFLSLESNEEKCSQVRIKKKKFLPFNSVIPLAGVYPKAIIRNMSKNVCTPLCHEALFTALKIMNELKR